MGYLHKSVSHRIYILLLFLCINTHPQKTKNLHIVILGSSTAYGTGASSKKKSWVGLLKTYVKSIDNSFKVTNLSKPGITSYHILPTGSSTFDRPNPDPSRNITKAIFLHPDIIIINLPSNDIAHNFSGMEQYINFLFIIDRSPIPIYVTTTQPRNEDDFIRHDLKELGLDIRSTFPTIDFWKGIANKENKIKPEYDSGDGIHLNDEGHKILFERVIQKGIIINLLHKMYIEK